MMAGQLFKGNKDNMKGKPPVLPGGLIESDKFGKGMKSV